MTMNSCSAIFRAFTKDRETAVDHKINAIEKQLSVITKLHAKDMKEMKALIESVSKASVENLKVDSSIKEEINEIKEEDKKELAFMIANVEKELKDAREKLEKLKPTPKLGEEIVDPVFWSDDPVTMDGGAALAFDRPDELFGGDPFMSMGGGTIPFDQAVYVPADDLTDFDQAQQLI